MLGLAAARSSRRYTPAITKWATCRGGRPKFNLLPFRVYSNEVTNEDATTQSSSSSEVLSTPNSLVESTDEAEPELPPPSPPE
jgi:hypothetical protein